MMLVNQAAGRANLVVATLVGRCAVTWACTMHQLTHYLVPRWPLTAFELLALDNHLADSPWLAVSVKTTYHRDCGVVYSIM